MINKQKIKTLHDAQDQSSQKHTDMCLNGIQVYK